MRIPAFPRRTREGSVIIYALIVLAAGTLILAGWVQLLATRAAATSGLDERIQRRIALENSRLLASQYILENVLPFSYGGTTNLAVPNGLAEVTFSGTITGAPLSVTPDSPGSPVIVERSAFSPAGGDGYGLNITASLSDGVENTVWNFQTRSRSTIFGHDLFSSQTPTERPGAQVVVSSGWGVLDNAVVWVPNSPNDFDLTASTYQTPTVGLPTMTPLQNEGGSSVLLSNFAFPPVTSGTAGVSLGYDGSLNVVNSSAGGLLYKAGWPPARSLVGASDPAPAHVAVYSSDDDLATEPNPDVNLAEDPPAGSPILGVSSDGAGTVTIDLAENNSQLIYITNDIHTLVLQGDLLSTADYVAGVADDKAEGVEVDPRAGVLVVYVQDASSTRDLVSLQLVGQSNRRIYLALKKEGSTPTAISVSTDTSGARWRFAGVVENVPIQWNLAGDLQLIGGLRSDAGIDVSGGTIRVYRDTDPRLLSRHADRLAWLEVYRE